MPAGASSNKSWVAWGISREPAALQTDIRERRLQSPNKENLQVSLAGNLTESIEKMHPTKGFERLQEYLTWLIGKGIFPVRSQSINNGRGGCDGWKSNTKYRAHKQTTQGNVAQANEQNISPETKTKQEEVY